MNQEGHFMAKKGAFTAIIFLLWLASAGQQSSAADGPEDWDNQRYRLFRGNMQVHTWISDGTAARIDVTINSLNNRVDFAGISDYSDQMDNKQWTVNRGACSDSIVQNISNLSIRPLPGFEWELGGPYVPQTNTPNVFHINIFGADRLVDAIDNSNAHHNNVANGEMINVANPLLSDLTYVMLGMNFYDNRYSKYGDYPNNVIAYDVSSLYSWMDGANNDPYGLMTGQFDYNGADDTTLQNRLVYLDKDQLKNRQRLQKNMCLLEVSGGDTAYRGIKDNRHYYNLALCNRWLVAPSNGIDNAAPLAGNPNVSQRFMGLWADDNDARATDPNVRAKRMLLAMKDRRSFVTENPNVTLKLSAAICDSNNNNIEASRKKMGGDIFLNSGYGGARTEIRFTVTLAQRQGAPADDLRYTLRNNDIKLVRIGEYNKASVTSGLTPVVASSDVTTYFTTTTVFKAYHSSNFQQAHVSDLVNSMLQKNGSSPGSEFTIAQNPSQNPHKFDLRDGPLTLTCDDYLKPFDYVNTNKGVDARVICYYAIVRFDSGEYAISSPIWAVGQATF